MEELKPNEVMLGNFVDSMGELEMITELVRTGEKDWFMGHMAWGKKRNPMPEGVQYSALPIPLTQEWKLCLGIDKYEGIPEHIKYVHEVQNWLFWHLRINLIDQIDWLKLPKL